MKPPDAYAETPEGLLLIADGLSPVLRWDGAASGLLPVGVTPPAAACGLAGDAGGADPRPAAPLTACDLVIDSGAAAPTLPATPAAPTVAVDRSRDVSFAGGLDPTAMAPTFPPNFALEGSYTCAMRYRDSDGNYSAWSALSAALAVPRTDGLAYPPNVFALKYTSVPVPASSSVVRRQIAINAELADGTANNVIGAGDTAGAYHYLDIDTADVTSTEILSNEAVTRGTPLRRRTTATLVDLAEVPVAASLTGSYTAYVRFVDAEGRFSDFSPASGVLQLQSSDLAYGFKYQNVPLGGAGVVRRQILRNTDGGTTWYVDVDTTDLTGTNFTSDLSDADLADREVAVDGVATPGLFGDYYAYVRFVNDRGAYSNLSPISNVLSVADDEFVYGVTYSGVPVPTEANVVGRQILRNTGGQATTFYVDIDTADLAATTFSSSKLDDELDDQEAAPLFNSEGVALANRFGLPPAHKTSLAAHSGRTFMAVDRVYSAGCVKVTNGSTAVTGVATQWTASMVGRQLYVTGAAAYYQIASVDVAAQTLVLLTNYAGTTDSLAGYIIRPAPAERRLVYYTEAGEPESWPATNALSIQEDSDEITGLMVKDSFLFVLEKRHIYRFTFQADPAVDGFVYLGANRGCVNDRCWVLADGVAYMLDESGVHAFDGGGDPKSVSERIRPVFSGQDADGPSINWAASALFHAALHPDEMVVRFFVALAGEYAPRHALCYDYAQSRWWIEEYDRPVTSSCPGVFLSRRRAFYGGSAGATYLSHEGALEGVDHSAGRTRGTVTSADLHGLTDSLGGWPSALAGASVTVVSGRGAGQRRQIVGQSDTRLRLRDPWLVLPDATSVYQIGGVRWSFASGWLKWQRDEDSLPRRVEVVFRRTENAGSMVARVYRDFNDEPVVWQVTTKPSDAEGFTAKAGSPDLVCATDVARGFAQQRMPGHKELHMVGCRYVSVGVSGASGDEPQGLFQVAVDGAEG